MPTIVDGVDFGECAHPPIGVEHAPARRPEPSTLPDLQPASRALWLTLLRVRADTIAREWRFKWSADDDKASLAAAQKLLTEHLATVKAVKGVKSVQVRAPLRSGCSGWSGLLRLPLRSPLTSASCAASAWSAAAAWTSRW